MSEGSSKRLAPRWANASLKDHERQIDMVRLRAYRMARVQTELKQRDYGCALLVDPINIRYATGSRNMSLWCSHTPARYCLLPAEGKAILFDFHNCEHLAAGLETIAEVRPARGFYFFGAGNRVEEKAKLFADEIADLVAKCGGGNRRVAVDRLDPPGTRALEAHGIQI